MYHVPRILGSQLAPGRPRQPEPDSPRALPQVAGGARSRWPRAGRQPGSATNATGVGQVTSTRRVLMAPAYDNREGRARPSESQHLPLSPAKLIPHLIYIHTLPPGWSWHPLVPSPDASSHSFYPWAASIPGKQLDSPCRPPSPAFEDCHLWAWEGSQLTEHLPCPGSSGSAVSLHPRTDPVKYRFNSSFRGSRPG